MNNVISFTIPTTTSALTNTANALTCMAADLNRNYDDDEDTLSPADNAAIESRIPTSEGGTMVVDHEQFDEYWARLVSTGAADELGSMEYNRRLQEWIDDGCQPLTPPGVGEFGLNHHSADPDPTGGPASPPAPAGVELDADGLPWDVRLHGKAKKKTAKDGRWKKIRNVDPELVKTVEAELRAAMAAPAPATSATPPAPPAPGPTAPPAPGPTAPPASPPAPAPVVQFMIEGNLFTVDQLKESGWTDDQMHALSPHKSMTFPDIMAKITPAVAAGTITQEQVLAACGKHGLASLPLLAARPDLISAIDKELFGG